MGGREGVGCGEMMSRRHRQRSNTVSWCPLWYMYMYSSIHGMCTLYLATKTLSEEDITELCLHWQREEAGQGIWVRE